MKMQIKNAGETAVAELGKTTIGQESYFKISHVDALRPFLMSIVSDANHWMFISSNGGLTAGRKNAQYALFPYYTDDKITESIEVTGSKTIFHVEKDDQVLLWEPFSDRFEGMYQIVRNLYKSSYGNKVVFEEINQDLGLTFRYHWNSSNEFGFIRRSELTNNNAFNVRVSVLDGIQNVLPYGVGSDLQNATSNLVDAYKRSELLPETGLGIFALSAIVVDKAEPSEALKANTVWSLGWEHPTYLLSSLQVKDFRRGRSVTGESDIKAEKGAYFINTEISLAAGADKEWMIIADVNQDHAAVAKLAKTIRETDHLWEKITRDIDRGTENLIQLCAASDGLQFTSDTLRDSRHFSNTLFNIMRGGIFDDNYNIEKWDFIDYLTKANKTVSSASAECLETLPSLFSLSELNEIVGQMPDKHLKRLVLEYMPLKFSRRHGDPSRPWNVFSINTQSESDGSKILDYQGNWRDIFQNWEALAHSYPQFMESMIHKFLNATTFDGYNPYRVTKGGFDWETIEPDDPWSYIGYWGDHQIIYLLKFLEFIENYAPGKLTYYFTQDLFVYANVPYKIKPYEELLKHPKDTIDFDRELDHKIRQQRLELGADGALLRDQNATIHRVNFIEKILATCLAKLSNFIPEGGIWMNTQRPEWNDANNALVGNGVSMVTLYYLRRFLKFLGRILDTPNPSSVEISTELRDFFKSIFETLKTYYHLLSAKISDEDRKKVLDGLGRAGSDYRIQVYHHAFSGQKETISIEELKDFVALCLQYLEHTIDANKRTDGLYHAYNLVTVKSEEEVAISHLSEMLEGQVAVLSAGYLSVQEILELLDTLRQSDLFREDQLSYLLYPNKSLPKFVEKNKIPKNAVDQSALLTQLVKDGNLEVIHQDVSGDYHFNGNYRNASDLEAALHQLSKTAYQELIVAEQADLLEIFEAVFNHKAFTGRSGTFYGYEGLGSIYWHMVSKLQLAVQECYLKAIEDDESKEVVDRLLAHYYEISEGIGVHKPPSLYGAFPTDPYSHTPAGKGAQQPGMTGQVKEDILSRFGELGIFIRAGKLRFDPTMLRKEEFLDQPRTFSCVDVRLNRQPIQLEQGELCFTYCQVPIIYRIADNEGILVIHNDGTQTSIETLELDGIMSQQVFARTGIINRLVVCIHQRRLK